jgi:hypothetical protein
MSEDERSAVSSIPESTDPPPPPTVRLSVRIRFAFCSYSFWGQGLHQQLEREYWSRMEIGPRTVPPFPGSASPLSQSLVV